MLPAAGWPGKSKGGILPTFEEEFTEIVRESGPSLQRLAAAYASTAADQEDLFQDILFAIWGALPRFRAEASRRTYVYRIAHNRGLSWRARSRPPALDLESRPEIPDPGHPADQRVIDAEDADRLLAAVRTLSPPLRQVVLLQLEGLEAAEIAEVLGVSTNVVHVRAHRAREGLRVALAAAGSGS